MDTNEVSRPEISTTASFCVSGSVEGIEGNGECISTFQSAAAREISGNQRIVRDGPNQEALRYNRLG